MPGCFYCSTECHLPLIDARQLATSHVEVYDEICNFEIVINVMKSSKNFKPFLIFGEINNLHDEL